MKRPICPCDKCGKTKREGLHERCINYKTFRLNLDKYNKIIINEKARTCVGFGVDNLLSDKQKFFK